MNVYISNIIQACIVFPLVAALLTVPYMVHQYRKRGSIPWFFTLIVYSFVFYLLCCYFLVLLPLPEDRTAYYPGLDQLHLVPFNSFEGLSSVFQQGYTPLQLIKAIVFHPCVYQFLFNILMLVPLGMYLRYFFKCSFLKTMLISLAISLSFETLQFTGILGMYEHPYRAADIDDLIANTLGGCLGFLMAGPLARVLPNIDAIDARAREQGVRVSALRRLLAFLFDVGFTLALELVFLVVCANYSTTGESVSQGIEGWVDIFLVAVVPAFVVLYCLVPALTHGQTLGQKLLKMCTGRVDGTRAPWYRVALRYFLTFTVFRMPIWAAIGVLKLSLSSASFAAFLRDNYPVFLAAIAAMFAAWVVSMLVRALVARRKNRSLITLPGLISGTRIFSLKGLRG